MSRIFRVQNESPIRVLTADIFSIPSTMFELSSYAAGLAKLLAEASSLASIRIRPFNKLVLDYLDIEAEEGENSDRNGSPSW